MYGSASARIWAFTAALTASIGMAGGVAARRNGNSRTIVPEAREGAIRQGALRAGRGAAGE
jgi:hypothetical protein